MPNKNYLKGTRKERRIVNDARENGHIAARTAGSHSPIDCFIINKEARVITFVQSKPDSMSELKKNGEMKIAAKRIHDELDFLNGQWVVIFELI